MIKELVIRFGNEFPGGERLYPEDFDLSNAQFDRFQELDEVPGFSLFPNGDRTIWVKQTKYSTDEEFEMVIEEIQEGFLMLIEKALDIKEALTKVPAIVTFRVAPVGITKTIEVETE
jgi:hypothetical protein